MRTPPRASTPGRCWSCRSCSRRAPPHETTVALRLSTAHLQSPCLWFVGCWGLSPHRPGLYNPACPLAPPLARFALPHRSPLRHPARLLQTRYGVARAGLNYTAEAGTPDSFCSLARASSPQGGREQLPSGILALAGDAQGRVGDGSSAALVPPAPLPLLHPPDLQPLQRGRRSVRRQYESYPPAYPVLPVRGGRANLPSTSRPPRFLCTTRCRHHLACHSTRRKIRGQGRPPRSRPRPSTPSSSQLRRRLEHMHTLLRLCSLSGSVRSRFCGLRSRVRLRRALASWVSMEGSRRCVGPFAPAPLLASALWALITVLPSAPSAL